MRKILLSLSYLLWWTTVSANGGSTALDNLILQKKDEIHRTRSYKGEELNRELNQFFDELIKAQENDLKKMTDLRSKLFPGTKKDGVEGDRYISDDIAKELRKFEKELYTLARKFQERLSERQSQEEVAIKVEINDHKKGYEINAEVPGVARQDIKIGLKNNSLIIEAERKEEVKTTKNESFSSEFSYGEFKRIIKLQDKVNAKSMKVNYKDGIIQIHLDKV